MKHFHNHMGNKHYSQEYRVAVIGLGQVAEHILLPALSSLPSVQILAGCDMNPGSREEAAKRWKIPRLYADPEELFIKERPDIAVIATPPLTHAALCLLATEYGAHVFCEKPFVASLEEADQVMAAARDKGRLVVINNQYYQMPIFRKLKDLIEGGQYGHLYHVNIWQHMYLVPEEEGGWKADLQSRRVLFEFGTHPIDLACQFFGSFPAAVTARIPRVHKSTNADVFINLRLDFPGDRVANILINRVSHAPLRYLEMRLDCEEASLRTSLGGVARLELGWNSELGRPRLRYSFTRGGEARLERDGRSMLLVTQSTNATSLASREHFSQFLSAIELGVDPLISAAHAREVLRTVYASYASASAGGRLIRLEENQAEVRR